MEKQIKQLVKLLQWEWGMLLFITVSLCICFEAEWIPTGIYADNFQLQYISGTIGILLTVSLVPLSLKLFSLKFINKIKEAPLAKALKLYQTYSQIRLAMIAIVILTNLTFYYFTLQNIGGLCTLIGVTASFFCITGERNIKNDLDLNELHLK